MRAAVGLIILMLAGTGEAAERVLVAGATGRTGSAVLASLTAKGYVVRALARDVDAARAEHGADIEWVGADVRNPADVRAAFEQGAGPVDYVVSAIGSREWVGPNSAQFVDYLGTRNLVAAAKAARVRNFVMISTGSIGPHSDQANNPTIGYIGYWKERGEDELKSSGLPYTIIGPGGLWEQPAGVKGIKIVARRDYKTAGIAIGDAAMVAVDALTNPDHRNKSYAAVNDESLPKDAWRAAVATMPVEPLSLPPVVVDEKTATAIEALDPPEAPIQRFLITGYKILARQGIAIPGSDKMFCTLSNASNVQLNWFPRERSWKFEILFNENRDTGSGGLATCHRIAMP